MASDVRMRSTRNSILSLAITLLLAQGALARRVASASSGWSSTEGTRIGSDVPRVGSTRRHAREGRRPHSTVKKQIQQFSDWDGQPSWEWDYGKQKTIYFEPVAGLGNRLRALASAVVLAREAGVGLKVIWREEVDCGVDCGNAPPFNSTWPDLFSYPNLRLADNFPGSNLSVHRETIELVEGIDLKHPGMKPIVPGFNCSVWYAENYTHFQYLLANKWTHVNGEEVLCVKSDLWLTKHGEMDAKFFFRILQPSEMVQTLVNDYKRSMNWDHFHVIGTHIRRTDLALTAPDGSKKRIDALLSLSKYIDPLRKLTALVPSTQQKEVRYFMATDDAEAEKIMKSSFEDGIMMTYPKTVWARDKVEGIQQALVEVLLLSDCPVLVGTYYSSYSETAKLMGWPFYVQIGNDLRDLSLESKFEASKDS